MSRVTVFAEGISLAHVTRPLLVARRLVERGHEITFVTGPKYQAWARSRGMDVVQVWTPDAAQVYGRLRRMQPMLTEEEIEHAVKADLHVIEQTCPDVVLGDCRNSLRISTALAGVPYAALTNTNTTHWFGGPLAVPAQAVRSERLASWLMRYAPRRVLEQGHRSACKRLAKPYAHVAKALGAGVVCDDFRVVFTSDQLTLLADDPGFNPAADLPEHARFVGPLDWPTDPTTLDQTAETIEKIKTQKLLVVSLGSTGSSTKLACIKRALTGTDWSVVVVGASPDQAAADRTDTWHAMTFADMPTLLQRASACVCHGGNGTVYQAIRAKRPVLAYPTFFDQETQALLLERAGLGGRLWTNELRSATQFHARLMQVIESVDPSLFPELAKDAGSQAADQIERLVGVDVKQATPVKDVA